ncbi:MAG: hypothetical protein L3J30_11650 [Marinosulfonomonas sp.]|nr:hypothetical protein [Marinosulfonomonas sp.]
MLIIKQPVGDLWQLASFIPRDGKVLVLSNGAYGKRIAQSLECLGRDHVVINKGDYMTGHPQTFAGCKPRNKA